jgi:hypothetical protein
MRLYHFSLFIFLTIMSTNILNSLGVFNYMLRLDEQGDFQYNNTTFVFSVTDLNPLTLLMLIFQLITIFYKTLTVLPFLMEDLKLPTGTALAISSMVWFIYGIGAIQFLLNRSLKAFE